jgi:hypothetical protein
MMGPKVLRMPQIVIGATIFILMAGAILLNSCGMGSDTVASGGIGGSGVTIGTVTDYGSIFVNGIEYDTQQADVFVENKFMGTGDAAAKAHIHLGQQVVVDGTYSSENAGRAETIEAFIRILGPVLGIEQVTPTLLALNVMGQQVYADSQTHWSGASAVDVGLGQLLAVSGLVAPDGAIQAGHISIEAPHIDAGTIVSLKGEVQQLDLNASTFFINDLGVDYTKAENGPDQLENGVMVSVSGTYDGGMLVATSLTSFETDNVAAADHFSIEGFLDAHPDTEDWQMGPYRIRLDKLTVLQGLEPEEMDVGLRIQISGRLDNHILQAQRIVYSVPVKIEGTIQMKGSDLTLTLKGLGGASIQFNPLTKIHGQIDSFAALEPDDHIRLHGFFSQELNLLDIRHCFVPPPSVPAQRMLLQGPMSGVDASHVAIAGLSIDTTTGIAADAQFLDENGAVLDRDAFFNRLSTAADTIFLRASGELQGDVAVFNQISILQP